MSNIIIKHSNGYKAGLVETFSMAQCRSLKIGRGRGNDISFDPGREDMVSRSHCIIVCDKENTNQYYIEDMGSLNGTYVNNILIKSKTLLNEGDIITVGKNGPKIELSKLQEF